MERIVMKLGIQNAKRKVQLFKALLFLGTIVLFVKAQ